MCEYTPGCTLSDDPVAVAIWNGHPKSLKRAVLVLRCHEKRHPMGAVFDLPDRGRVLVSPHQKMLARSIFADPADPGAIVHQHAALYAVDSLSSSQRFHGRCACGTWAFDVLSALERQVPWGRDRYGVPYAIGNYVSMADDEVARYAAERTRPRHGGSDREGESTSG